MSCTKSYARAVPRVSKGAKRRAEKAENPNRLKSYNIHDRETVHFLLDKMHQSVRLQALKQEAKTGIPQLVPALGIWIANSDRAYVRYRGDNNKYRPHQGKKECARRAHAI